MNNTLRCERKNVRALTREAVYECVCLSVCVYVGMSVSVRVYLLVVAAATSRFNNYCP